MTDQRPAIAEALRALPTSPDGRWITLGSWRHRLAILPDDWRERLPHACLVRGRRGYVVGVVTDKSDIRCDRGARYLKDGSRIAAFVAETHERPSKARQMEGKETS